MGRVWPRHSHRGRPLNAIVSRHVDIATLRELPDYIEASDIEAYCVEILGESQRESRAQTLQKLKELTDRQWHTLQEPSLVLKQSLESWLRKSWSPASPEFLETCLGIGYTFALSRGLFEAALSQYAGESEWEYREHLAKSPGPFIDPYWSLRAAKGNRDG